MSRYDHASEEKFDPMDSTLHLIAQVGVLAGVFTSILAVGGSIGFAQILESLRDIRTLLLALVANFVAVPLFALLLARILPLDDESRTALILLGAVAGAPFLPKLAELSRGHVPFSIGLMVLLMVVTVG
jgi:predicted Na+-dependent transporter